jgi:hypothetical protein
MTVAMLLAVVLAGLSALCLGLVDAGQQLDTSLAQLDFEAATMHKATVDLVERRGAADRITRPRNSLAHMIDSLDATSDRIVRAAAPPYARPVGLMLGSAIDLMPRTENISRAMSGYIEQADAARAETSRSANATELMDRLLELSYSRLAQQISDARERTREGVSRALSGVQLITLISIGIAAVTLGLTAES